MILGEPIRIIGDNRNEVYFCCEALRSLVYPFRYAPTPERNLQYQTYISNRGRSMQIAAQPMPGLLGMDTCIVNRVVLVSGSHIVMLDQNQIFELRVTTDQIALPKY